MALPLKLDISLTTEDRDKAQGAAVQAVISHLSKAIPVYNQVSVDKRSDFLERNPVLAKFIELAEKVER